MEELEEIKYLGSGAFGDVMLARQGDTLCAVKRLRRVGASAETAADLAEVKALRSLRHPCILRYYGAVETEDSLSLIMEYADAGDLQQLLMKRKEAGHFLEALALCALFAQLAMAVAHVHSQKVLHRDLKPSNVLLTSEGLAKLGDFGAAKVWAGTMVCEQMTCVGSPTYMAPEIASGEPYGPACDIWSLGVLLYELCTFRRPFEGRSLGELLMRISSGRYPAISVHVAGSCGGVLEATLGPLLAGMLMVDAVSRMVATEVMRHPSLQLFVASMKSCAACVAAMLREDVSEGSRGDPELELAVPKAVGMSLSLQRKAPAGAHAGAAAGSSAKLPPSRAATRGRLDLYDSASPLSPAAADSTFALSATSVSDNAWGFGEGTEVSFALTAVAQHTLQDVPTLDAACLRDAMSNAGASTLPELPMLFAAEETLARSSDASCLRDFLGDALGGAPPEWPAPPDEGQDGPADGPAGSEGRASSPGSNYALLTSASRSTREPSASSSHRSCSGIGRIRQLREDIRDARAVSNVQSLDYQKPQEMRELDLAWRAKAVAVPGDALTFLGDAISLPGEEPPPFARRRARLRLADEAAPSARSPGALPSRQGTAPGASPEATAQPPWLRVAQSVLARPQPAQVTLDSDTERSVTWPSGEPPSVQRVAHQAGWPDFRSTTPPSSLSAGWPEAGALVQKEREQLRALHRNGVLNIPFFDGEIRAKGPPQSFIDSLLEHDARQKQRRLVREAAQSAHAAPVAQVGWRVLRRLLSAVAERCLVQGVRAQVLRRCGNARRGEVAALRSDRGWTSYAGQPLGNRVPSVRVPETATFLNPWISHTLRAVGKLCAHFLGKSCSSSPWQRGVYGATGYLCSGLLECAYTASLA